MAYVPERKSVFDDLIDDVFGMPEFGRSEMSLMRTDIREKDGYYLLDIELPSFRKEDIKVTLENGNLTVSAEHHETDEEKNAKGTIIRQERYEGACSRSWYVGESIRKEDIHASYSNGVLTVTVPTEEKKEQETTRFINID